MTKMAKVKEEKKVNKKEFVEDSSLMVLSNKVIKEHKLDYLEKVNVKYVLVDMYISKNTMGKCVRASKELKHFTGIDYVIQISKDIFDKIDDNGKEAIMLHLLLHILLTINKQGDLVAKIFNHDVADFSTVIKKFGIDGLKELRLAVASIRDMDISQSDNIKI